MLGWKTLFIWLKFCRGAKIALNLRIYWMDRKFFLVFNENAKE